MPGEPSSGTTQTCPCSACELFSTTSLRRSRPRGFRPAAGDAACRPGRPLRCSHPLWQSCARTHPGYEAVAAAVASWDVYGPDCEAFLAGAPDGDDVA